MLRNYLLICLIVYRKSSYECRDFLSCLLAPWHARLGNHHAISKAAHFQHTELNGLEPKLLRLCSFDQERMKEFFTIDGSRLGPVYLYLRSKYDSYAKASHGPEPSFNILPLTKNAPSIHAPSFATEGTDSRCRS